jgi:hypothetical protein
MPKHCQSAPKTPRGQTASAIPLNEIRPASRTTSTPVHRYNTRRMARINAPIARGSIKELPVHSPFLDPAGCFATSIPYTGLPELREREEPDAKKATNPCEVSQPSQELGWGSPGSQQRREKMILAMGGKVDGELHMLEGIRPLKAGAVAGRKIGKRRFEDINPSVCIPSSPGSPLYEEDVPSSDSSFICFPDWLNAIMDVTRGPGPLPYSTKPKIRNSRDQRVPTGAQKHNKRRIVPHHNSEARDFNNNQSKQPDIMSLVRKQDNTLAEVFDVRYVEPVGRSFRAHLVNGRSIVVDGASGYAFQRGTASFWED